MGINTTKEEFVSQTGWCQKFGQVQFVTSETSSFEGMKVVFQAKTVEQIYQTWEGIVKQLSLEEDINNLIVLPVSYGWKKKDHLCNFQKAAVREYQVIYHKIYTTLSHELKLRIKSRSLFSERQVWYIAYILVKVAASFEKKGFHLGNIHPKNIMINNCGIAQVFTIASSPVERENCEEVKESKQICQYSAPEETKLFKESKSKSRNSLDKNKIDSYYIGLIMLSLSCLRDFYFLFNHSESTIKFGHLNEMFQQLRNSNQYSFALYSILRNMLQIDPFQRKTPLNYYQILKQYEQEILQMKNFYLTQQQIEELTAFKNPQKTKGKRSKQIAFLTLTQHQKEPIYQTNAKTGKFKDDLQTRAKTGQKLYESRDYR